MLRRKNQMMLLCSRSKTICLSVSITTTEAGGSRIKDRIVLKEGEFILEQTLDELIN